MILDCRLRGRTVPCQPRVLAASPLVFQPAPHNHTGSDDAEPSRNTCYGQSHPVTAAEVRYAGGECTCTQNVLAITAAAAASAAAAHYLTGTQVTKGTASDFRGDQASQHANNLSA